MSNGETKSWQGVGPYGDGSPRQKHSKTKSTECVSDQTKKEPFFWGGSPSPNCVTCYLEQPGGGVKAVGMVEDKGGGWLPCPDCAMTSSCLNCVFCGEILAPDEDIWCAKWGKFKSAWMICEYLTKR